jgi:predicted enzyme related to lactoylglutathione lyase
MDSIVHFEIPADKVERAKTFYSKAFGWMMVDVPQMEYTTIITTQSDQTTGRPTTPGAINGGMGKKGDMLKAVVVTIGVQDVDASLEKIKQLGGKTVQKKMPVGDMGFSAYFKDTEGNVIGLWQATRM